MKKKNILKIVLVAAAAALLLTACSGGGSKETQTDIDVQALADELNSKVMTTDTLSATASEMIPTIYYVKSDDIENAAAYMSSGATADEVCVIESKSSDNTSSVEDLFKQRVQSQSSLYASYKPEESTKLDSAIVESTGKYTVLVVCDDYDAANDILKNYGF